MARRSGRRSNGPRSRRPGARGKSDAARIREGRGRNSRVNMAPGADPPPRMPDSARQQVRLRRFLLASAFSVLYLVVLGVFRFHDGIDRATLLQACTIVALLIVAFSILFVSRLNLRFADPSLTAWQLLASVFTMLYIAYRAPDTRL